MLDLTLSRFDASVALRVAAGAVDWDHQKGFEKLIHPVVVQIASVVPFSDRKLAGSYHFTLAPFCSLHNTPFQLGCLPRLKKHYQNVIEVAEE